MEGVGARLGRSSTRYGPATVFTGPVRRWKKKWVHVAPPSSTSFSNHSHTNHSHHQIQSQYHTQNGTVNGNNCSHLLLYKWTRITQSQNAAINGNSNSIVNINGDNPDGKDEALEALPEEPPRRKFKYIPCINAAGEADQSTMEQTRRPNTEIAVLDEQKTESIETEIAEKVEDEAKASETDTSTKIMDEKPDINDVPMEENQSEGNNRVVRQDLNESTLDFGLNLNAESNDDPDSNTDDVRNS